MQLRQHQVKALDVLEHFLAKDGLRVDGERWVTIDGFSRYAISDHGRVFSAVRSCRMLSATRTPQGYPYVSLMLDGKAHKVTVHRLVAAAFIPNVDRLPVINHKDGDKSNNLHLNLEWCTYAENNDHARDSGLVKNFGGSHYAAKLSDSDIIQIRVLLAHGSYHKDIAAKFGVKRQQITKIANGKAWGRA